MASATARNMNEHLDESDPEPTLVSNKVEPIKEVVTGLFGQVKWFNNSRAYGWITVIDGQYKDNDVFVHMKNLNSKGYKTLITGEYVQFNLSPSIEDTHPYHATDVTGLFGRLLMSEVNAQRRREQAQRRQEIRNTLSQSDNIDYQYVPRHQYNARGRGQNRQGRGRGKGRGKHTN